MFTYFGILIIFAIAFYMFFHRKNIFSKEHFKDHYSIIIVFMIFLNAFFNSGVFFENHILKVSVPEFTFYGLFCFSFVSHLIRKPSKNNGIFLFVFALYLLINNILLIINPTNVPTVTLPNLWSGYFLENLTQIPSFGKYVLVYDIYFLMSISIAISFLTQFQEEDYAKITRYVTKTIIFAYCILLFEILVKNFLSPEFFYSSRDFFFGKGSSVANLIIRRGAMSYYGLNSEPASFALTIFFLQFLQNMTKKKISLKYNLLTAVAGFLTASMLFIVYLIILVFQIILIKRKVIGRFIKVNKTLSLVAFILFFSTILAVSLYSETGLYFTERLLKVFKVFKGEEIAYSSELERVSTSLIMVKVFLSRPIFGAGLATAYGFSGLFSLMANIGTVGIVLLVYLFSKFIADKKFVLNYVTVFYIAVIIIVPMIQGNINLFIFPEGIINVLILTSIPLTQNSN